MCDEYQLNKLEFTQTQTPRYSFTPLHPTATLPPSIPYGSLRIALMKCPGLLST